jgi:HPt (histidine-containing phosphotransfer) domain-containing protein
MVKSEVSTALNIAHLETFTDGDINTERELFSIFFDQANLALKRLEKACETHDKADWKSAAYRFKGSAANLGAELLAKHCFLAESSSEKSKEEKQKSLDDIRISYAEVQTFLKDRLSEMQS